MPSREIPSRFTIPVSNLRDNKTSWERTAQRKSKEFKPPYAFAEEAPVREVLVVTPLGKTSEPTLTENFWVLLYREHFSCLIKSSHIYTGGLSASFKTDQTPTRPSEWLFRVFECQPRCKWKYRCEGKNNKEVPTRARRVQCHSSAKTRYWKRTAACVSKAAGDQMKSRIWRKTLMKNNEVCACIMWTHEKKPPFLFDHFHT